MPDVVQHFSHPPWSESDRKFMTAALQLARKAEEQQEVPIGAVLVHREEIIGLGWNRPISSCDPTSHAEIEALRQASTRQQNYRLTGTTLYVTLEPCVMCAGALVNARVQRLVFGARDIRFGAVRSNFALADSELLNHRLHVAEGLLAFESAELLSGFFARRRFTGP